MWARAAVGAALLSAVSALFAYSSVRADVHEPGAPAELAILEPIDDAVYARIEGQTADLPWRLTREPEGDGEDRLARAAEAAASRHARAALWITRSPNAIALHLYDPQKQRLFERSFTIDRSADAMAESAAFEALALSLRSALRALALDEPVGEQLDSAQAERARAGSARENDLSADKNSAARRKAESSATERVPSEESPVTEDRDRAAARGARAVLGLAGGWAAALDGQSPVQHGPWVRASLGLGALEFSLRAQTSLHAEIGDTRTKLELARQLALAGASLRIFRAGRFSLHAGVEAGLALFPRKTLSVASGLQAKAPYDVRAFAAELELRARFALISGPALVLCLELGASVLALPAPPLLRYEYDAMKSHVDWPLWALQPQLSLGPLVSFSL